MDGNWMELEVWKVKAWHQLGHISVEASCGDGQAMYMALWVGWGWDGIKSTALSPVGHCEWTSANGPGAPLWLLLEGFDCSAQLLLGHAGANGGVGSTHHPFSSIYLFNKIPSCAHPSCHGILCTKQSTRRPFARGEHGLHGLVTLAYLPGDRRICTLVCM